MKGFVLAAVMLMFIGLTAGSVAAQEQCIEVTGLIAAEPIECPEGSVSPICLRGTITGDMTGEYTAQVPSETTVQGYGLDKLASAVIVVDFEGILQGKPLQLRVVPFGVADRVPGGGGAFAGIAEIVAGTFDGQPGVSGRFSLSGGATAAGTKGPFNGEVCVP